MPPCRTRRSASDALLTLECFEIGQACVVAAWGDLVVGVADHVDDLADSKAVMRTACSYPDQQALASLAGGHVVGLVMSRLNSSRWRSWIKRRRTSDAVTLLIERLS